MSLFLNFSSVRFTAYLWTFCFHFYQKSEVVIWFLNSFYCVFIATGLTRYSLSSPLLTSTPCVGGVERELTQRNSWLVVKNIFDMLIIYLINLWLFFISFITFLQFTTFVIFWNISILSCILINFRAWHTHLVNLVVSKIIVQYCIKYTWKYTNIYIIHYHTIIPHIIWGFLN